MNPLRANVALLSSHFIESSEKIPHSNGTTTIRTVRKVNFSRFIKHCSNINPKLFCITAAVFHHFECKIVANNFSERLKSLKWFATSNQKNGIKTEGSKENIRSGSKV